ncbi:hypothetical protein BDW74DRAFT_157044 [Aspergillus multicolor]|uniref:uncharacterized protein n=1 Tax=Aspergillus multicolor TaxID=41759 RepID=UPI003CCD0C7A
MSIQIRTWAIGWHRTTRKPLSFSQRKGTWMRSLALPYSIESYPDNDGKRVKLRTPTHGSEPWQHGECPFFIQHSTRLATIFDRWRKLVEDGICTVDEHGVHGGIEFYRQAEDPAKTEWFCLRDVCFDFDYASIAVD